MAKYLTNNSKWCELWSEFWKKKLKEIPGFANQLSEKLKKPVPSTNAALTHFKKGEDSTRIGYFLEDPVRRESFLSVLGMPSSELESILKDLAQKAETVSVGKALYPNFNFKLKDINHGWIEPRFNRDNKNSHWYNNPNFLRLDEFINRNLKSLSSSGLFKNNKIIYIKAKTGKTRLIEYLKFREEKKDTFSSTKPISFVPFQVDFNSSEDSSKITIFMIDVNQKELRSHVYNYFKEGSSFLIFLEPTENEEDLKKELGFPEEKKDRRDKAKDPRFEVWEMEVFLELNDAFNILAEIQKFPESKYSLESMEKVKSFLEKFVVSSSILPSWCDTLESFTKLLKFLLDQEEDIDLTECESENILSELLLLKIINLLPKTLSNRRERAENLLASFVLSWIKESLNTDNQSKQRYKGSFLLQPEIVTFNQLWNNIILKKKSENIKEESLSELWEQLDHPKADIKKLREILWPWKLEDSEELAKICTEAPLFTVEASRWYSMEYRNFSNWTISILKKMDETQLKDLFPALAHHQNDNVIDSLMILELLFSTIPDIVLSPIFQETLSPLVSLDKALLILVAASVSDHISVEQIQKAWKSTFDWWNNYNEIKENIDNNPDLEDRYDFDLYHLANSFINRNFERLRKISKKYCEKLEHIKANYCIERGVREQADWYQYANFVLQNISEEEIEEFLRENERPESPLNKIEKEPLVWLADKGNKKAINLLVGRYNHLYYLERSNLKWTSDEVPDKMLSCLGDERLLDFYRKLSLDNKKKFFLKILTHWYHYELETLTNILKIIKKINSDFFTKEVLQDIWKQFDIEKYPAEAKSFSESLSLLLYKSKERNFCSRLKNFFVVIYQYFDEETYEDILAQILIFSKIEIDPQRYLMDWDEKKYYFDDLEFGYEILQHYLKIALEKKDINKISKFFDYLDGYTEKIFQYYEQSKNIKIFKQNHPNSSLTTELYNWITSKGWSISDTKEFFKNSRIHSELMKLLRLVEKQFNISLRLELIDLLESKNLFKQREYYYLTKMFRFSTERERSKLYLWLLEKLKQAEETNELRGSLFSLAFKTLDFMDAIDLFVLIKEQQEDLYFYLRKYCLENRRNSLNCSLNHEIKYELLGIRPIIFDETLFLRLQDDNVTDSFLNFATEQEEYKTINYIYYHYYPDNQKWWLWFFQKIEGQKHSLWPQIIQNLLQSYREKTKADIFILFLLNEFLTSLPVETQIQRFFSISKQYHDPTFQKLWLIRLLEEDFKPYHNHIEKLINLDHSFVSRHISGLSLPDQKRCQILSLLEKAHIWLDWSVNQQKLPHVWLCILLLDPHVFRSKKERVLLLDWCYRQFQNLKKALSNAESTKALAYNTSFLYHLTLLTPEDLGLSLLSEIFEFVLEKFHSVSDEDYNNQSDIMNILIDLTEKLFYKNSIFSKNSKKQIETLLNFDQEPAYQLWRYEIADQISYGLLKFQEDIEGYLILLAFIANKRNIKVERIFHRLQALFSSLKLDSLQNSRLLEIYLKKYISTEDLAFLTRIFFYWEIELDQFIDWSQYFSNEEVEDQKKNHWWFKDDFLLLLERLGLERLLKIAVERSLLMPEEKKLWFSLLRNFFQHHPHKEKIASLLN